MVISIWAGGRTASKTYYYVPYALNLASHVLDYFGPQFVCSLAFAYILCWFFSIYFVRSLVWCAKPWTKLFHLWPVERLAGFLVLHWIMNFKYRNGHGFANVCVCCVCCLVCVIRVANHLCQLLDLLHYKVNDWCYRAACFTFFFW